MIEQLLENIARDTLGVPTLRTQDADDQDFKELAVWQLREALQQAYAAGAANR